jgi:hypothetical protein
VKNPAPFGWYACQSIGARQLLQQLSQPLSVAHILELTFHNFIVDPFIFPEPR